MRKFIILLLLLISSNQLHAQVKIQSPQVRWGELMKESSSSFTKGILDANEEGFITYRYNGKKKPYLFFEHYDAQMRRTKIVGFDMKLDNKTFDMRRFINYHGKLWVLAEMHDTKKKINKLYIQQIDKSTLMVVGTPRLLLTIDYAANKEQKGWYGYVWSNDASRFLIFYNTPEKEKTLLGLNLLVLDKDMQPLWEKQLNLNCMDEDFSIKEWAIDNYGNIYVLGKLYYDEDTKALMKVPYKYQLYRIMNEGEIVEDYALKLDESFLNNLKLRISPKQDVICAGFYSPTGSNTIKGSYFFSIDARTGTIKSEKAQEFNVDFLTEGLKSRKAERIKDQVEAGEKEVELYSVNIDRLTFKNDGGVVLMGEYYKRTSYKSGPVTNRQYQDFYYYYNILVVNLNATGEQEWAHQIAKKQESEDDGGAYSSYSFAKVGDNLYFFFNDHPDNLQINEGKVRPLKLSPFFSDTPLLVAVEIDKQGDQKRIPVETYANSKVIFRPDKSYNFSSSQMIIYGDKGLKERFAIVKF